LARYFSRTAVPFSNVTSTSLKLGKILLCQVLDFVGGPASSEQRRAAVFFSKGGGPWLCAGAGFLWTTFFWTSFDGWGLGPTTAPINAVSASTILVIPEGDAKPVEKNMGRAD
jgi:hypothetical protein